MIPSGRRRGAAPSPLDGEQLPTSPRSLNRQVKLHRLLKQLHSQEARYKTFEVSNESDQNVAEFELVAHIPDKTDYVQAAVQGLEKNT